MIPTNLLPSLIILLRTVFRFDFCYSSEGTPPERLLKAPSLGSRQLRQHLQLLTCVTACDACYWLRFKREVDRRLGCVLYWAFLAFDDDMRFAFRIPKCQPKSSVCSSYDCCISSWNTTDRRGLPSPSLEFDLRQGSSWYCWSSHFLSCSCRRFPFFIFTSCFKRYRL